MGDLKIDDASYQEGRAAFAAGASLRGIVEQIDAEGLDQLDQLDQIKVVSSAIGFFDALLDLLRSKPTKKAKS